MPKRHPSALDQLEARYRGLAIEDGVLGAAAALSREVGSVVTPIRRRRDSTQFPFQAALAQQVRAMEAQYGHLLEALPDPVIATAEDGTIVFVNAAAEQIFGYEYNELFGHQIADLVITDGRVQPRGGQAPSAHERIGVRRDGSRFPLAVSLGEAQTDDGPLSLITIRDISAHKSVERRLIQQEARARTMLEDAPDPMLVVSRNGRIVQLNARAETTFGYVRDALIGQQLQTILPQIEVASLALGDAQPADADTRFDTGAPVELTGRRQDQSTFVVEVTAAAVPGAQAGLITFSIRNIDARIKRERALDEGDTRCCLALDAAPDAMIIVADTGDIVHINAHAERRFGHSSADLEGLQITRIIPEGFIERLGLDALRAAEVTLSRELGTGIHLTGRHKDGVQFPIEVMFSPFATGNNRFVVATIHDPAPQVAPTVLPPNPARADQPDAAARHRDALERRLRELDRSNHDLQQFAHVAANSMRAPLAAIEDVLRGMEDAASGADTARQPLDTVLVKIASMARTVDDLLAYGQVGHAEPVTVASATLVEAARAALASDIERTGASLACTDLPDIVADPAQITQLFVQLISNALTYRATAAPQIRISASLNRAGEWVFVVSDNGVGIERHYLDRIFLVFQRLHHDQDIPGSGIGLALCRKIAERHGGRIWAESQPGLGSSFFIVLPRPGAA